MSVRQKSRAGVGLAWGRVRADISPLLQRTAAATIAWFLAIALGDHPDPFFAPIAAVVSLNASFGERGLNALRLLGGVIIGIVVAESVLFVAEGSYGSLAVAMFVAMALARAFGGAPVVVAQAAASAILTIAVANGQGGPDRLVDALLGAGVALVFSQLLFTPEPIRLMRRAESTALRAMAEGLRLTGSALAADDHAAGDRAMQHLREMPENLAVLAKTRVAGARVIRHSPAWRSRAALVVHEQENVGHLDLLGISCLMLARTSLEADRPDGRVLAGAITGMADLLSALALDPADTAVRQSVVDQVPGRLERLERELDEADIAGGLSHDAAVTSLRVFAVDLLVFAGIDVQAAVDAVKRGTAGIEVSPRPRTSRFLLVGRLRRLSAQRRSRRRRNRRRRR